MHVAVEVFGSSDRYNLVWDRQLDTLATPLGLQETRAYLHAHLYTFASEERALRSPSWVRNKAIAGLFPPCCLCMSRLPVS